MLKKNRTDRAQKSSKSGSFDINQTIDSTMDRLKNLKSQRNARKEVGSQ